LSTAIFGHARRAALMGLIGSISLVMAATAGVAAAQEGDTSSTSMEITRPEVTQTEGQTWMEPAELVPAQESTTSTSDEEPPAEPQRPLVSVLADCYDGFKSLAVWVEGADGVTYEVTLAPAAGGAGVTETSSDQDGSQLALFVAPPPDAYVITVVGTDGSEGGSEVTVEACSTLEPGDPVLTVEVKCVNDYGTVFIRVSNPDTGEVRTFSVDIDGLPLWDGLRLDGGFFVDIVEQDFEDGTYTIALLEDGQEVASEEITVACAPVPTTTPEPTTTTPAPTTTTPAPQGGTPPSDGLASTGAAVGGLAVLGLVALAMGSALVLVGRRRRTADTTPE